ncbi:MAG TPA: uroporphyrinogen-III C-methyltransferase, partial [Ilumatobacteraceae bacterium]|nr:uroporphyrinogen-III C-methyltransferase [Ilumatobacteraceae bacterium]
DPPHRGATQDEINQILVGLGRRNLDVVRLKGGDPFVFGRGGEEAIALASAGIPYSVVPGVTSAVAAPMAAGVPITHRNIAPAFTVVTGHRAPGNAPVDWQALAQVGGTIVVLMGVTHRASIAAELIVGGLAPETPVCAVTWATHDAQVITRTTLASLGNTPITNPATIVIGAVAALDLTSPHTAALRSLLPAADGH